MNEKLMNKNASSSKWVTDFFFKENFDADAHFCCEFVKNGKFPISFLGIVVDMKNENSSKSN